jgi:hypothetical protein
MKQTSPQISLRNVRAATAGAIQNEAETRAHVKTLEIAHRTQVARLEGELEGLGRRITALEAMTADYGRFAMATSTRLGRLRWLWKAHA